MPLVHRWGEVGHPPGNRTLPFPVICQISQAYKARPLPRAADIQLVRSVGFEPTVPTFSTLCVCRFRHECKWLPRSEEWCPSRSRTHIVGLEDRLPFQRPGQMGRAGGLEPHNTHVGNVIPKPVGPTRVFGQGGRTRTCCLRVPGSVV